MNSNVCLDETTPDVGIDISKSFLSIAESSPTGLGSPDASSRADRSVIGRVAAIFETFDDSNPILLLTELSARTGLPKSTVHRLASQLLEIGWLERAGHDGYRVGMRVFEIGGLASRRQRLREKAAPALHDLCANTRLSAHLGVLDAFDVLYLERLVAPGIDLPTRQGGRMPAYCTALGKAMLAFEDEEVIERAVVSGLERRTPSTIVSSSSLFEELKAIRRRGVALDHEEAITGVHCVAAPIRGSGRAVGAISVVAKGGIEVEQISGKVRRAADYVWREMFNRARN